MIAALERRAMHALGTVLWVVVEVVLFPLELLDTWQMAHMDDPYDVAEPDS